MARFSFRLGHTRLKTDAQADFGEKFGQHMFRFADKKKAAQGMYLDAKSVMYANGSEKQARRKPCEQTYRYIAGT
jgi:hypothetical protein